MPQVTSTLPKLVPTCVLCCQAASCSGQVEALGRAHGQKAGAQDQTKPRDHLGTSAEPGQDKQQGSAKGPATGSAERPIHALGATDIPHGKAVEPSYNQAPTSTGKADPSFQQAAAAFATSPTENAHRK